MIDTHTINKIAIFGWGLMGDVLMRVPIIEAIRQRFPQAHITVIVDPIGYDVLSHHPDINRVIIFPRQKKPRWRYLLNKLVHLYRLRQQRFDLTVDLYFGRSCPFTIRCLRAPWRLGFAKNRAHTKANNLLVPFPKFANHWISSLATLVEPLGISPASVRLGSSFYCTSRAKERVVKLLGPYTGPFVAINLGASDVKKCWPIENYASLAEKIYQQFHFTPILFTNPGQEDRANCFYQLWSALPLIKLPVLSIDDVAAVMLHCHSIVSGDTGLLHLAFAVKTPALAIFTYTRPECITPVDSVYQVCFVEDEKNKDTLGRPCGKNNISVDHVFQQFCILQNKIK